MEKQEISHLKSIINEQIEQFNTEVEDLKDLSKTVEPDSALGERSRMDAIQSQSINEAALNLAEAKLRKLHEALERIEHPEFGFCEACGANIPYARLELMPESTLCVRCAEKSA